MRNIRRVVCGGAWLAFVSATAISTGFTQDFATLADGAARHTASGWVFPKSVGEFQRVGEPEVIAGMRDAVAQYERSANGLKTTATVYVYPPDSQAADSSLAGARRAIEQGLKSANAQIWSEGPFRASQSPELVGEKTFYKIGIGPDSSQTNLYYFDTGKWVVKIRLSVQKTDKDTFQRVDAFVRGQSWADFGLTAENCTGSACRVSRPIPVHGALPEQLAVLLVSAKLKEVFPSKLPACDANALAAALIAPDETQSGASEPIRLIAACSPDKGIRASFLRMDLDQDIRDSIESRSPDGLSMRGPITFVVRSDGKSSIYTMMLDGALDTASVTQMVEVINGKTSTAFARGDKHGKNPQLEIRFINQDNR